MTEMFSWKNLECHRSFNYWQFISHVFLSSAIAETQNFLSEGLGPCAFMCFPPPPADGLVGTTPWPLCDVQPVGLDSGHVGQIQGRSCEQLSLSWNLLWRWNPCCTWEKPPAPPPPMECGRVVTLFLVSFCFVSIVIKRGQQWRQSLVIKLPPWVADDSRLCPADGVYTCHKLWHWRNQKLAQHGIFHS